VIEEEKLVEHAGIVGSLALARLRAQLSNRPGICDVRGRGLVLAVECTSAERASKGCAQALRNGVIALVSGDEGNVVSITPPLCIEREILELALDIVAEAVA
jgi:4-aminobutyrate aminotransferase-like enzyme